MTYKQHEYNAAEFAQLAKRDFLAMKDRDRDILALQHGDHKLNPDISNHLQHAKLHPAAVLIPVTDDGPDARVILTKRTDTLRKHSGQVAFAGGRVDKTDESVEAAALREAWEEIGLERDYVETVGQLPIYRTMTGFSITPVLAIVRSGYSLTPNPDEVSDIFEVQLSDLMNEDNHLHDSLMWQDKERFFYTIKHPQYRIWGVTAGLIRTLYERLYA